MKLSNWRNYLKFISIKVSEFVSTRRERIMGRLHLKKLLARKNKSSCVLLIEFHNWHGETLPGYVKYFYDLGYDVAVAGRLSLAKDNPFGRFSKKPAVYYMSMQELKDLCMADATLSFAFVMVTSDPIWFNDSGGRWVRLVDYAGSIPCGISGGGIIMHELFDGRENPDPVSSAWTMEKLLEKTFALTPVRYRGVQVPMLNPCSFGDVRIRNAKNDMVTFITIGSIKTAKRNFSELFEALGKLKGKWRLLVVGSVDDPSCLAGLPGQVEVLGRLSFKDMYEKIETSDFILPLLDPDFEGHKHYLESCTSGSRQLILGFAKVPVMDSLFGIHYGFTEESAVLHGKGGLPEAMQKAVDMSSGEYAKKVENLKKEYARVYDESLANLEKRLPQHD